MLELGGRLSEISAPGMVIALTGSLGAGKTTLVKGIAEGLGIKQAVTSPSFTIIKEYYEGRLPLFHMDLYRIDNYEELYMIGFEELIYGIGLSIIEWSEKAEELIPPDAVGIEIKILSDGRRTVFLNGIKL
ncbi:MAG TPA: tRNA (adenosine(37)-N6)-threonylcarbamoyltransferase complex ATPase subunit type 1 TsaE [Spirochaeta sp.]|nr:tRNA (adenosine(37)-N6)-threonylcarbamoyltransferase complex ATPase subunit type 1 TsaE [Spirochaeta sp.]